MDNWNDSEVELNTILIIRFILSSVCARVGYPWKSRVITRVLVPGKLGFPGTGTRVTRATREYPGQIPGIPGYSRVYPGTR